MDITVGSPPTLSCAELLNRITNVGTEIVNAINSTAKPQNVKEINKNNRNEKEVKKQPVI